MTENQGLKQLLAGLLHTEQEISGHQETLKKLVEEGANPQDLVKLVQDRKVSMQKLSKLDILIDNELKRAGPAQKSEAEATIQQVGARLAALAAGEQELLIRVERQLKGKTQVQNMKKQGDFGGGKLDVSY